MGILIKLPMFTNPVLPPQPGEQDTLIYRELLLWLHRVTSGSGLAFSIITYILIFVQALQLNNLVNKNRMMQRMNYLPATAFLIITSLAPEWNYFSAPLIINNIILLIFSGLFSIYNQYSIKGIVYNIGLAVGVSSFIFFPSLVLFIWLIFALMVMRSIRLNEWLICLLGVTTPYYFYAAYLFYMNNWSWTNLLKPVMFDLPSPGQSLWIAGASILLIIPFLIGGYFVQENLRKMLIQVRKDWSLMLIYLLFALFIPFINNSAPGFQNWIMIIVPFASFHACTYLYPPQRWLPAFIFWLSIAFILVYQYAGPGWH